MIPVMENDKPRYRRAVVVFVELDAVDERDAANIAVAAVDYELRSAATGVSFGPLPITTPPGPRGIREADVIAIEDLEDALRSGGLRAAPTDLYYDRYAAQLARWRADGTVK